MATEAFVKRVSRRDQVRADGLQNRGQSGVFRHPLPTLPDSVCRAAGTGWPSPRTDAIMPRQPRIDLPGIPQHIVQRGKSSDFEMSA